MEKCPKCDNYAVTFDSYHGIVRCIANFCDYVKQDSLGPTRINSLSTTSGTTMPFVKQEVPKTVK